MNIFKFQLLIFVIFFASCEGGINSITVERTGNTLFSPKEDSVTKISPVQSPSAPAPKPVIVEEAIQSFGDLGLGAPTIKDFNITKTPTSALPSIPPSVPPVGVGATTSILEGLPEKQSTITFTQRESLGMPRVNGEEFEADIYGNILIVRYTKDLLKIRYSNDITNFTSLGEVEGSNARVPYPIEFVKLFFLDSNGDNDSAIFGATGTK